MTMGTATVTMGGLHPTVTGQGEVAALTAVQLRLVHLSCHFAFKKKSNQKFTRTAYVLVISATNQGNIWGSEVTQ